MLREILGPCNDLINLILLLYMPTVVCESLAVFADCFIRQIFPDRLQSYLWIQLAEFLEYTQYMQ